MKLNQAPFYLFEGQRLTFRSDELKLYKFEWPIKNVLPVIKAAMTRKGQLVVRWERIEGVREYEVLWNNHTCNTFV